MFGMMSRCRETGEVITGSAAQLGGSPWMRSYFELLERASIEPSEPMTGCTEFNWTLSRSNGIALHQNYSLACNSAYLELIERDRVLRSWYGFIHPQSIDCFRSRYPSCLESYYQIETLVFPDNQDSDSNIHVIGIFGLSRGPRSNIFGFGAGISLDVAWTHAWNEFLQQLGFLWDEEVDSDVPTFSQTPDYHLDLWRHPERIERLKCWLKGGHMGLAEMTDLAQFNNKSLNKPQFIEITPVHLKGLLSVVKAQSPRKMPLVFGKGHPWIKALPAEMETHPIA
jgi:hypothetical protein